VAFGLLASGAFRLIATRYKALDEVPAKQLLHRATSRRQTAGDGKFWRSPLASGFEKVNGAAERPILGAQLPSGFKPTKRQVLARAAVSHVTRERQKSPKPRRLAPGAARPSNPIQNMNEWHKLGSGEGGLNDRKWVIWHL
jgi:hypothetical protein